jgi:hypothetical protein
VLRVAPKIAVCLVCAAIFGLASSARADMPSWLPRYDLNMRIDVDHHQVSVDEQVHWTNPHQTPTNKIVFNAHAHYSIPDEEVALLAKMLEILRLSPRDALDFGDPPLQVQSIRLLADPKASTPLPPLKFSYQKDNDTALEVELPFMVGPGESVSLDLQFLLKLPQKQGRWGQWKGVTFLAQWLPVVAYYDDAGWQPTPFIPWHQPFFNEAGIYSVKVALPQCQKLAASSTVQAVTNLGNGWQQLDLAPICVRDFALFCSADFQEFLGDAMGTQVRVVALPGHEWYAKEMVKIACEAIPVYNQWFGPYPYPQLTVVESYFGWNGNECGGLVMIDERIFALPHVARNFVDGLLSHEICHQWFYNVIGTNGYGETWMDEGPAVYLSGLVMDQKLGINNTLLTWPKGLGWLPNINRDDYSYAGLFGCMARGDATPVVQPMPEFGHLVTLMAMTYERGGRVVGMIDNRLGRTAFLDFMKQIRCKYEYRILRVADFQHELELYTGRSWQEFFQDWLYKTWTTDWAIDSVKVERDYHTTIVVRQKGKCMEPTVLGIRLDHGTGYHIRLPIIPGQHIALEDFGANIVPNDDGSVVVDLQLPCRPTQITVDPDKVLLDSNPTNNHWKPEIRCRIVPVYTQVEESDLTNSYDQWNFIAGPWVYGSSYSDPWYTRSDMFGLRAGIYRTQEFSAGAYLAYRTEDRNIVAGVDALWDHFPIAQMQIGFNFERSLTTLQNNDQPSSRGVLFGRYVFMYGDSLYLPPFHYVDVYGALLSHNLPDPEPPVPNANPFSQQSVLGVHYHINFLTPYWDPEGGFAFDASYQQGFPICGQEQWSEQAFGQLSWVKGMPDCFGWTREVRPLAWLMDTRWAMRLHIAGGLPDDGLLYPFGGGDLFRGYDNTQRQGSSNWIGSIEWRVPIWQNIEYPMCDHIATAKNLYTAFFCDVGDSYLNSHQTGPVAYAAGVGLRFDVSWFGLIERTTLRLDFAKTINDSSPTQVWIGIQHPF